MEPNSVQTQGLKNKRYSIGICYPIIPENVDRDTYVQDCFRRGIISVQCEDGSVIFNIRISVHILQVIDFPSETKQLGSALVYGTEYHHNSPIIIGRLLKDDESTSLTEHEFKLEKYTENGSVSISGKAKDGNLFIKVAGKSENGGKIFIDVVNPENKGAIVVNLQGDFQIELQKMVLNILDDLNIITVNDVNINSIEGVINLGDIEDEDVELEPVLLGTKTVEELDKEIQALTDLLISIAGIIPVNVTTGAPDPTWAVWQAAVAAIINRGDLAEVKSEKTFTE